MLKTELYETALFAYPSLYMQLSYVKVNEQYLYCCDVFELHAVVLYLVSLSDPVAIRYSSMMTTGFT